jgi:DNA repair exonuclease SbcCD ATPase subunit
VLRLKKLHITAFGRFVDRQTIDFDELGSLVQVDAINNNTGGSSGSAKSTIFNAADYLLGLNDIPASIFQSRLTKEPMLVEGEFDLDGRPLMMARGKNRFSIDLDGAVTSGSSKLTEEKLDEILAMPRSMFRPMLHKRQKEGGFFLQMTPGKIHDFLMDCSGLSEMRVKLDKTEEIAKENNIRLSACDAKMRQLQGAIGATRSAILSMGEPPTQSVDRLSLINLKAKADSSMSYFERLVRTHEQEEERFEVHRPKFRERAFNTEVLYELNYRLDMVEHEISDAKKDEERRAGEAQQELKNMQDEAYALHRSVDSASMMRNEAVGLAIQIRSLKECICPTCSRTWSDDGSKKKIDELSDKLMGYETLIDKGTKAKVMLDDLRNKIDSKQAYTKVMFTDEMERLEATRMEIQDKIQEQNKKELAFNSETFYFNNQALKDFSERQKEIKKKHEAEQEQARGQTNLDRLALESVVNALKSFENAKARYDEVLSSLKGQEKYSQDLLQKVEEDLMDINDKLKLCDDAKKAIKSYISCSFDDALVQIGEESTKIIRNIPNMVNATIQLEGIRETKEGRLKEEVNAVISVDGEVGVPIKSLSGGERSAVDLAIDLAVIDLIQQKTGKGIDLFILDEPFTGLDTVSIEMALEMLKNSHINKRLLIVDHNPEVKQKLESKITVVRDGLTSRIEQ